LQPERHAAEVHSERVAVHAVDAMADHIADGFADTFGGRLVLAGAELGEFFADAPGGGEEHVAGAARDINDFQTEQCRLLLLRASVSLVRLRRVVEALMDHGNESAFDQFVYEFGRRIIRAGCFAFRAENEDELKPSGSIGGYIGMKFE